MILEKTLKGPDFSNYDTYITYEIRADLVVGSSAGRSSESPQKRNRNPNEDYVKVAQVQDWELYLVADGNSGHRVADMIVEKYPSILEKELSSCTDPKRALYGAVFEVSDVVRNYQRDIKMKMEQYRYRTDRESTEGEITREEEEFYSAGSTFIAVIKKENTVHYISVGDSRIYLFDDSKAQGINEIQFPSNSFIHLAGSQQTSLLQDVINELSPRTSAFGEKLTYDTTKIDALIEAQMQDQRFAGIDDTLRRKSVVGRNVLYDLEAENSPLLDTKKFKEDINHGTLNLQRGSTLLLVTDGIEEPKSGMSSEDLRAKLTAGSLIDGVKALFERSLQSQGYWSDNIGLVAVRG